MRKSSNISGDHGARLTSSSEKMSTPKGDKLTPLNHTPKTTFKSYSFEDNFGVANMGKPSSHRHILDTTLPSLSANVLKSSLLMTGNDFSNTLPIFRRGRYDVFGSDGKKCPL